MDDGPKKPSVSQKDLLKYSKPQEVEIISQSIELIIYASDSLTF